MKLKILNLSSNQDFNFAPAHLWDAGFDLRSNQYKILHPGERTVIQTGLCFEIERGHEGQIRPRSGLTNKRIDVFLGTIDCNYRGEVGIQIQNNSKEDFIIESGDRIAQVVFLKLPDVEIEFVNELEPSTRNGGFGHTGIK